MPPWWGEKPSFSKAFLLSLKSCIRKNGDVQLHEIANLWVNRYIGPLLYNWWCFTSHLPVRVERRSGAVIGASILPSGRGRQPLLLQLQMRRSRIWCPVLILTRSDLVVPGDLVTHVQTLHWARENAGTELVVAFIRLGVARDNLTGFFGVLHHTS